MGTSSVLASQWRNKERERETKREDETNQTSALFSFGRTACLGIHSDAFHEPLWSGLVVEHGPSLLVMASRAIFTRHHAQGQVVKRLRLKSGPKKSQAGCSLAPTCALAASALFIMSSVYSTASLGA